MSYWDDVAALAPTVSWRQGETSGTVATDSAGTDQAGTYTNSPTLGQPGIIPNVPASTSVRYAGGFGGGTNGYIDKLSGTVPSIPTLTNSFTFLCWVKLDGLDSQRELMGKIDDAQVWIETTGQLTFYCTPPWTGLGSTVNLTVGPVYMVAVRKNPTHMSVWINGVKRGEVAHTGTPSGIGGQLRFATSSVGPRYLRGYGQGFEWWHATALSDADILALYNSGIAVPNDPPTTPGAYTVPTLGQVIDAGATLAWGASMDPESDAITYEEQVAYDGGAWGALHALQSGASYPWDTSLLPAASVQVRVRAFDGLAYSGWQTSPVFAIAHVSALPVATVTIPSRSDKSILVVVSVTDPDTGPASEHEATQYQVDTQADDFAGTPKIDTGWITDYRKNRIWLVSMPANTAFYLLVRARDVGGQVGEWTKLPFHTRRVFTLGVADGFEQERNEGTHEDAASITSTWGTYVHGVGFVPGYPDLSAGEFAQARDERGYRLGYTPIATDYVQPVDAVTGPVIVTRYGGSNLNPTGAGNSFMFIFDPRFADPAGKNLLFGSEGWWIYRWGTGVHAWGGVNGGSFLESFLSISSGIDLDGVNILLGTYKREIVDTACMLVPPLGPEYIDRVTVPGTFAFWLNGTKSHIGTLHNPVTMFPIVDADNCPPDPPFPVDSIDTRDMGFNLGGSYPYLWLGTQASDGARAPGDSNYYGYTGEAIEFAWWNDHLITNAEAAAIYTAFQNADPEVLGALVKSLNPILYDRFRQPMQPSKPILTGEPNPE